MPAYCKNCCHGEPLFEPMTNNNVPAFRPTRGPVSKYNAERHPKEAKFLASRGATQSEIAECFGLSRNRFRIWMAQYPELNEAVLSGNDAFTARVEHSLAERAIGYDDTWDEEVINPVTGELRTVRRRRHYPADVGAIKFHLTNRAKDRWREQQNIEVETKRETSQEILDRIYARLAKMREQGYLTSINVPALPAPEDDSDVED